MGRPRPNPRPRLRRVHPLVGKLVFAAELRHALLRLSRGLSGRRERFCLAALSECCETKVALQQRTAPATATDHKGSTGDGRNDICTDDASQCALTDMGTNTAAAMPLLHGGRPVSSLRLACTSRIAVGVRGMAHFTSSMDCIDVDK